MRSKRFEDLVLRRGELAAEEVVLDGVEEVVEVEEERRGSGEMVVVGGV